MIDWYATLRFWFEMDVVFETGLWLTVGFTLCAFGWLVGVKFATISSAFGLAMAE